MINDLCIDYEAKYDLLYASIGAPVPALNVEVGPGIYLRVSPVNNQVVGLEVLDCASSFGIQPDQINQSFVSGLIDRFSPVALRRWNER